MKGDTKLTGALLGQLFHFFIFIFYFFLISSPLDTLVHLWRSSLLTLRHTTSPTLATRQMSSTCQQQRKDRGLLVRPFDVCPERLCQHKTRIIK